LEPVEFGVECPASKFDLSLFISESAAELAGAWVYRTDLFDAATIRTLSKEFQALLAGLLTQPDVPIEDVEVEDRRDSDGHVEKMETGAGSVRRARRKAA